MSIRSEIASVTLAKVEHLGDKYIWLHAKEQEHVRPVAKALGKTAKQLNGYLASSSLADLRVNLEKVVCEDKLTITLVLLTNQDGKDVSLFKDQTEELTKQIRVILKDALTALDQAIEIGDNHPNCISIVGYDSANIHGAVTTSPLVANIANAIRGSAHDVNGLKLTLTIEDENHELTYFDSTTVYDDCENIGESQGFVKSLSNITSTVQIKPDGEKIVELAFKNEHREMLGKSLLTFKPVNFRWVSKLRYRNGEPIVAGGQIIEVKEPLELELESTV